MLLTVIIPGEECFDEGLAGVVVELTGTERCDEGVDEVDEEAYEKSDGIGRKHALGAADEQAHDG